MKFLVILICLLVNYLWLKDFDRFDDGWFFRFRCRIEEWAGAVEAQVSLAWALPILLVYSLPLLILAVILFFAQGVLLGFASMMLHILILLVALDRTQPGQQAKDFLARWRAGDMAACLTYLQQEFNASNLPNEEDKDAIGAYFSKQLAYRSFEKMFVMFFWYMCTGPLGVLFAYISYQLQDSHQAEQERKQVELISLVIQILEWVPLRLLALTFSLAGNFVKCFENLLGSFWQFGKDGDNAELLYSYASCAISGLLSTEPQEGEPIDEEAAEIEALLGLLERSQAIWLCVLALITILGM